MKQTMKLFLLLWATILCPFTTLNAQDVWDGSIAESFAGGTGTQDDPYLISNGEQLAYLAKITNDDPSVTEGKYYKLVDDIILNENVLNEEFDLNGTPENLWTPIADTYYNEAGFMGDFNGNGHCISGLYIVSTVAGYHEKGLFGSIHGNAVIHDLAIVDSHINGLYASGLVSGTLYDSAIITRCYVSGSQIGSGDDNIGLVAGYLYNSSKVEYCYAYGKVTGTNYVGGLLGGKNGGSISNSFCAVKMNMGYGVIGDGNYGNENLFYDNTIAPNVSAGNAVGKTTEEMQSEGFAELLGEPFAYADGNYPFIEGLPMVGEQISDMSGYRLYVGELANAKGSKVKFFRYYDGTDVSKSAIRAEAGETVYVKVIPYKRMLITGGAPVVTNDATGAAVKLTALPDSIWSFTMPESTVTVTASFYKDPKAPNVWDGSIAESFAGGTGTEDDPYLISSGEELAYLAQITNADEDGSQTKEKFFKLTADIVLNRDVLKADGSPNGTPKNIWTPIGESAHRFFGNFDGGKHRIYDPYLLRIDNTNYIGIFGFASGAYIHDLCVVDGYIADGTGCGFIVGQIDSNSKVSRCYASGYIEQGSYSGLIVGAATITCTIEYCYSVGFIGKSYNCGGIVGWASTTDVSHCFSLLTAGAGNSYTGSCVGQMDKGKAEYLYHDNSIFTSSIIGRNNNVTVNWDNCKGLTPKEIHKPSFAELLGTPFEYVEGGYPWIPGMIRTGEYWGNGHQLTLGEVTNGEGCTVQFFKHFDGENFSGKIPSGDRLDLAAGETVYVHATLPDNRLWNREGGLQVVNKETGQSIDCVMTADTLITFAWPAAAVELTANFIVGGYCGKEDVNEGRDVWWERYEIGTMDNMNIGGLLKDGVTLYSLLIRGEGEMRDMSSSTVNRPWGGYYAELSKIYTIDIGEGITRIGAGAFRSTFNVGNLILPSTLKTIGDEAFKECFSNKTDGGLMAGKTITFPAALDSVGGQVFYGCGPATVTYDLRACKGLKDLGLCFQGATGKLLLPSSIVSIGRKGTSNNGITGETYIEVPENTALYVNGSQMPDENGMAKFTQGPYQYFALEMRPDYYRVNIDEFSGEGCSLAFYATMNTSYQLSNQFNDGMRAFSEDEDAKVYIKSNPAKDWFLHKDWIVVKKAATGEIIPLTQEQPTIFSFVMPACDVTVSAGFRIGGYCGRENGGTNVWYEIVDDGLLSSGSPAYKIIFSGTGATGYYSSNNQTKPWNTYKGSIKSVEFKDGITAIGNCFLDNTYQLLNVRLPNTLVELGGYVFFNCAGVGLIERWDFPATLEKIGDSPFRYTSQSGRQVVFDLSKCTNMKSIITSAFESTYGIKILPSSIEKIAKQAMPYSASTDNNVDNSIKMMVPEDKVVYVNGVQQVHTGDTLYFDYNKTNASAETTIEMRSGYHYAVKVGTVTGNSGSSFKFYGSYDGTNLTDEITPNTKAYDDLLGNPIYVKLAYGNYKILDEDGLRIVNKRTGERVPIDTVSLANAIYSFSMPRADVEVSVDIVMGGYCGHADVNKGYDVVWRAIENGVTEEGKTTYKLILSGKGPTASYNGGYTPWSRAVSEWYYNITELDVREGITALNSYITNGLSGVKKPESIHLPNSLEVIGDANFVGMGNFEGTLVLPGGITRINGSVFGYSSFDLDLTNCTRLKSIGSGIGNWGTQREGMRIALPESIETIEGQNVFYCSNVDLSRCTKLTNITQKWFNSCNGGEIILPGSMQGLNNVTVSYGGFYDCTSKLSIAPFDDKILYINGERMEEVDGKVDISAWMGQTVEFDWRPGFSVKTGTVTGGDGAFRYYTDYDGSNPFNEIPNGYKVYRETDDITLYVQAESSSCTVFPEDLTITSTIDGVSQPVDAEELKHNLFRFTLPAGAVKVSGKFSLGGYCGGTGINDGLNTRWEITADNRLVISGEGEVRNDGWHIDKYPWRTVKAVEVCEGITGLPALAFSNLNCGDYYTPINSSVVVTLPSTLESIGAECFNSSSGLTVDMSKCTKLTTIGDQQFLYFAGEGNVLLPTTIKTIYVSAFGGAEQFNPHVYYPVADNQVLLANGQQVKAVDGNADIATAIFSAQGYVELSLHTGYFVSAAANSNGVLKVYADQALTQEIQAGFKAICDNDNTPIYIKVIPNDLKILFKSGMTVKGASGTVAVTQESDDVFSFLMPAEAVTVSAKYATGGYCGENAVNNGHNLIWTLSNGTLAFQKNTLAVGNSLNMGSWASGKAPWNALGGSVKSVDLSGVKNIGSNAFSSCTELTGLELPASPVIPAGENAFAGQMVLIIPAESWDGYKKAGWDAYAGQTAKDKESFSMKDGQQWRTYYSKVGRLLPRGLKAYTITGIGSAEVSVSQEMDYIPAGEAVLIENAGKEACTAEVVTSLQPYSQQNTPVCLLTSEEDNLLQWITVPTAVTAGQGYTLYKDEFVKVSSGTLPAGVAFLPAQGVAASRLFIFNEGDEETGIDIVEETAGNDQWYTIDGKKLSGKPTAKGLYIRNGQKVMMK